MDGMYFQVIFCLGSEEFELRREILLKADEDPQADVGSFETRKFVHFEYGLFCFLSFEIRNFWSSLPIEIASKYHTFR